MFYARTNNQDNIRVFSALILSIGFHILMANSNFKLQESTPLPTYSDLNLILDEDKPINPIKRIMVSPSENLKEEAPKKETNLLSDKDTNVEREQIKRGLEGSLTPPIKKTPQKVEVQKATKSKQEASALNKKVIKEGNNLFIDPSKITMNEFLKEQTSESASKANEKSKQNNESLIASMAGIGSGGNSDFLPGLPDGDITMLNAKADRFAVFVRRVALQVFSALRQSNWVDHPQLSGGFQTEGVNIRATLSAEGEFIKAEILTPSGLVVFDNTVLASVRKGAWDRNPPKGALAGDGTIKFIFQSKAWVRSTSPGRKKQWLLLGTGLE
jgi:outer membrane biosynthesis protein TonB